MATIMKVARGPQGTMLTLDMSHLGKPVLPLLTADAQVNVYGMNDNCLPERSPAFPSMPFASPIAYYAAPSPQEERP